MTRDELETACLTGNEIERLLENPRVKTALDGLLDERRRAVLALGSDQPERFVRLMAGIEAVEEFLAALDNLVELGRQAGQRLAEPGPSLEDRSRVL